MLPPNDVAAATAWDDFARAHGSFFHLSAWRGVVEQAFGHSSHYLTAKKDGALGGILPLVEIRSRLFGNALVSNGFCVGGGPLATDAGSLSRLVAQAEELGRARGVDYIELRDTVQAFPGWESRGDLYAGFEGPIAPAEEDNLKQIPRKQRAVLRKALAAGFEIAIERSPEDFFALYARTMRDHGTPALPKRFFALLLSAFGEGCEILTVRHQGRPVASVLSYYFGDRVMPYYTGSTLDARNLGANDMMYWALMRRAAERGCAIFDFGRSKLGTGPYNFKRNWGFEPRPITHQYKLLKGEALPNVNPTNPRYALLIRAWRRLPIPVANAISPLLSRSLG